MNDNFLKPNELLEPVINLGIKKAYTKGRRTFLLGIMAGIFIGMAYIGYMTAVQNLIFRDEGLGKLVGAGIFPIGIMLVLIVGGDLFTGNNLITLAYINKKIPTFYLLKNWLLVWMGNLVGSIIIAWCSVQAGNFNGENIQTLVINIAKHKVDLVLLEAIISGILCNILVALGVWMTLAAKDLISKLFAAWFPIMLFALSGYQHSVANMYILALGKFLDSNIYSVKDMFLINILPVSLGNIISGGILIPIVYNYLYRKNN